MIKQNFKALNNIIFFILLLFSSSLYSLEKYDYSYDFSEQIVILKNDEKIIEIDSFLTNESKFAIVGNIDSKYFCYIKSSKKLYTDLEWAYTNNFGIVLKYKSYYEIYNSNLISHKELIKSDFILPLPFDYILYKNVTEDFQIENLIVSPQNKNWLIYGNIGWFDGGIVFTNSSSNIEVLQGNNTFTTTLYTDYVPMDRYLWLISTDKSVLVDSELNVVYETTEKYEPATSFFNNKAVFVSRNTGDFFLLDIDIKELTKISDYKILKNELYISY